MTQASMCCLGILTGALFTLIVYLHFKTAHEYIQKTVKVNSLEVHCLV